MNSSTISNATRYIITILVKYQQLNDALLQQKEKQEILNELLKTDTVQLIDNFNIVLDDESFDFETTYQMILYQLNNKGDNNNADISYHHHTDISSCNVSLCTMIQRNNRDRITNYQISTVYYNLKNDEQIVILQLLDKIHCYFMHSFDFGLKFTKKEKDYIFQTQNNHLSMKQPSNISAAHNNNEDGSDPMLNRIKEIIDKKKQNISKTSLRIDKNRYITKIKDVNHENEKQKNHQQNNNKDDHKDKENLDGNIGGDKADKYKQFNQFPDISDLPQPLSGINTSFNFGKRWRYSKKYQNNDGIDKMNSGKYNDWFVVQRYSNLKREILSNSLKKIAMAQWNQIESKAKQFMKCIKVKHLKSCKSIKYENDSMPNIQQNGNITLQHIICILIYCNFTQIKNSFSDTFKPMNKFEQWKDVRSKHSEYANFGRILTETIECFGCSVYDDKNTNLFYHALLGSYSLHSIQARFFVPTSMTKELSVITYYCYNTEDINKFDNGLVIGLTSNALNKNTDLKYFDCSFLSDFTNESEIIFLGGRNTLIFDSIYNIKKLHNYQYYISVIHLIDETFINKTCNNNVNMNMINPNIFSAFKKCISSQVQEAHCIPSQIDYYLNAWCTSRKTMTINMTQITQNSYFTQLLTDCGLLIKYDNVYTISIDSLLRLFPNAASIKIKDPIFDTKCEILQQFHQFLSSLKFYGLELQRIDLINPSFVTNTDNPNEIISKFKSIFFNSGWTIKMPDYQQSQHQTPGGPDNYTIQILKQNESPRRRHEKSHSQPNTKTDSNPFSQQIEAINRSANAILSDEQEPPPTLPLDDNESSYTQYTDITTNTFTTVHIKMKIKKQNDKDLEVEFDFNHNDNPQEVASEMINELNLPLFYKNDVVNVIHACIPNINGNQRRNTRTKRAQSSSNMHYSTNVEYISHHTSYPEIEGNTNNILLENNPTDNQSVISNDSQIPHYQYQPQFQYTRQQSVESSHTYTTTQYQQQHPQHQQYPQHPYPTPHRQASHDSYQQPQQQQQQQQQNIQQTQNMQPQYINPGASGQQPQNMQNIQNMQNMQSMQQQQPAQSYVNPQSQPPPQSQQGLQVIHENHSQQQAQQQQQVQQQQQQQQQAPQEQLPPRPPRKKSVTISDNVNIQEVSYNSNGSVTFQKHHSEPNVISNTPQQRPSNPKVNPRPLAAQQSAPMTADQKQRLQQKYHEIYGTGRKQTVSVFDTPLLLEPFDQYKFPSASVTLLDKKRSEFHAEYESFLRTQEQIFKLKLEHIKIENTRNQEEAQQKLARSMQEKIDMKQKELMGKWDEFLKDQEEILILKQKISEKHLAQFRAQVHFENQPEFMEIMKSHKISDTDKQQFRAQLKEFRDKMINDYKIFRENHYGAYDQKLKEISMKQQQHHSQIQQIPQ